MKKSFSKWFLAPLSVVFLVSFTLTPVAEARGGGRDGGGFRGGGGGGDGGGRQAGAAAGNRAGGRDVQVNNSQRDVRATNVRNTSVNNVNNVNNVNVNRNVNVSGGGCCNNGWNGNYHPVATAAAVTATVAVTAAVIGSVVNTVPPNCAPYNYNGMVYQQCGSTWYQPQYVGNQVQYVVVSQPY